MPLPGVKIVDGEIWVAATPEQRAEAAYWRQRLHDGLSHNINLVIAKAVLSATAAGVPATELVCDALLYGAAHRDREFSIAPSASTTTGRPAAPPMDRPCCRVTNAVNELASRQIGNAQSLNWVIHA